MTGRIWMRGPIVDAALAWCWLPIAVLVHVAPPDGAQLRSVMGVVFLLSFAHQPLTLGLVYGDSAQLAAHRRMYRWAPVAVFALVVTGLTVAAGAIAVVAVIANVHHTLMQRYGVLRIYGRRAGDEHGRAEKAMLVAWMTAALLFIGGFVELEQLVEDLGVGRTNGTGVRLLGALRAPAVALFVIALVVALACTVRWVRVERASRQRNLPKYVYVAATFGLVIGVAVDPVAGVAGFVGAHAIEYFAVVDSSLRTRHDDAPVARATRSTRRRALVYFTYGAAIMLTLRFTRGRLDGQLHTFVLVYAGALHILYDGFIWKLRRPPVAAALGIAGEQEPERDTSEGGMMIG